MSPPNATLGTRYAEMEDKMLVLEKDKKEAAIEEDFEKALQCKKEIKELQAKIEETKDQLMKLF